MYKRSFKQIYKTEYRVWGHFLKMFTTRLLRIKRKMDKQMFPTSSSSSSMKRILKQFTKIWKQPQYTYIWYAYKTYMYIVFIHTNTNTMEYFSAMRKKDILSFVTKLMDIEYVRLSVISQRKTSFVWVTYMRNLKNQTHKKHRVKWWSPAIGGQGIRLMLFQGTNLQRVVNRPQRSDAWYNEYRQQYFTYNHRIC